ncbi:hypothetical protein [Nonomuraea sp. SYSU D8015]|uniref:hypothetical protein n=1 Tax=Nonomuraea sp. SYSU D8015 TaxID=2593644 RepID=UPI0016612E1C|nr:hypothetical protein [Nonomuraea sp. SYSU D8015]
MPTPAIPATADTTTPDPPPPAGFKNASTSRRALARPTKPNGAAGRPAMACGAGPVTCMVTSRAKVTGA